MNGPSIWLVGGRGRNGRVSNFARCRPSARLSSGGGGLIFRRLSAVYELVRPDLMDFSRWKMLTDLLPWYFPVPNGGWVRNRLESGHPIWLKAPRRKACEVHQPPSNTDEEEMKAAPMGAGWGGGGWKKVERGGKCQIRKWRPSRQTDSRRLVNNFN